MTRIGRRTTFLLVMVALALVGCEKREAAPQQPSPKPSASAAVKTPGVTGDTIKIGSYGPLSGPAAAYAVLLHGIDTYFNYVNAQGGVHGRKIDFVYRDDGYNPSKTPSIVRELVEKQEVFAMVGGVGTATGRAVADYLEGKGVPFFTPATGDAFWSDPKDGKKNVYTAFPRYLTEGEILGKYAASEMKAKRIAVLFQDDDLGKQGLEGVKAGVAKVEGSEVVVEVSCQPTDTDLSGQVSQIVAGAPDALILYALIKQAIPTVKLLEAQKKKPAILTSFVLSDPMMFKLAGDSWNGVTSAAVGVDPMGDSDAAKRYREVLEKHSGDRKLPVGNFTLAGFQFAVPFVEALHRAGKDLTREKLYTALKSFKDWRGPGLHWKPTDLSPPITFTEEQRLGSNTVYMATAKDGKWEKQTDYLSVDD